MPRQFIEVAANEYNLPKTLLSSQVINRQRSASGRVLLSWLVPLPPSTLATPPGALAQQHLLHPKASTGTWQTDQSTPFQTDTAPS